MVEVGVTRTAFTAASVFQKQGFTDITNRVLQARRNARPDLRNRSDSKILGIPPGHKFFTKAKRGETIRFTEQGLIRTALPGSIGVFVAGPERQQPTTQLKKTSELIKGFKRPREREAFQRELRRQPQVPTPGKTRAQLIQNIRRFGRVPFAPVRQVDVKKFGAITSTRPLTQQQITRLSKDLDTEGKILDQRIKRGLASNKEVAVFNTLVKRFNTKQDLQIAQQVGVPRAPKTITGQDIVGATGAFRPELTVGDLIPIEFGGRSALTQNIIKTSIDFGNLISNLVPGSSKRVKAEGFIAGAKLGAIIGATEPLFTGAVFLTQEAIRNVQQLTGGPDIKTTTVALPRGTAQLLQQAKDSGIPIVTDPLQFVTIGNTNIIVSRRAIAEGVVTGGSILLIFLPTGKARIFSANRAGVPVKSLGSISITPTSSTSFFGKVFGKLKLRDLRKAPALTRTQITLVKKADPKIIRLIKDLPEFKALKVRSVFEIAKAKAVVKKVKPVVKKVKRAIRKKAGPLIKVKALTVKATNKRLKLLDAQFNNTLVGLRIFFGKLPQAVKNKTKGSFSNTVDQLKARRQRINNLRRANEALRANQIFEHQVFLRAKRADFLKTVKKTRRTLRKLAGPVIKEKALALKRSQKALRFLKAKYTNTIFELNTQFRNFPIALQNRIKPVLKSTIQKLELRNKEFDRLLQGRKAFRSAQVAERQLFLKALNLKYQSVVRKANIGLSKVLKSKTLTRFPAKIKQRLNLLEIQTRTTFKALSGDAKKALRPSFISFVSKIQRTRNAVVRKILGKAVNKKQAQRLLRDVESQLELLEQAKLNAFRARVRARNAKRAGNQAALKLANKEEQTAFFGAIKKLGVEQTTVQKFKVRQFKDFKVGKGEKVVKTRTGQLQVVKTKTKQRVKAARARARLRVITRARPRVPAKVSPKDRARATAARTVQRQRATAARARARARARAAQRPKAAQRVVTKPVAITKVAAAQRVRVAQRRARAVARARQRARAVTRPVARVLPKLPPALIPPTLEFKEKIRRLTAAGIPYNVILRIKGKEVRVNKTPVTADVAFGLLDKIIDNSPTASGFVVRGTGKPAKVSGVSAIRLERYRKPKGATKLRKISLVEKNKFRIDTRGEKQGITARGLAVVARNRSIRRILSKNALARIKASDKIVRRKKKASGKKRSTKKRRSVKKKRKKKEPELISRFFV